MKITEQQTPQQSDRMFTVHDKFSALAVAGACALLLMACEGSTGPAGPAGADGPPGTGIVGTFEFIVQVDTNADNFSDAIVAVDPISFQVNRIGTPDVGEDSTSSLTNTHKTQFYQGNRWIGGTDLWAFDPVTFAVVPRVAAPGQFIQMNREGTVGPGLVNTKAASSAALSSLPKNLADYIGRTQMTQEEATAVNMCDVETLATTALTSTKAAADTLVHSIGYSPVGFELTPDGNMGVSGVRMGDHMLFLDTNPASPTFREPLRLIDQRRAQIKDRNNAVVATFPGVYTAATPAGPAPGKVHYDRISSGTSETDKNTYVEPCDTTLLRAANGQLWFWTVDVNGDTITGARVDTITTATPTVVQVAVPHLDFSGGTGTTSGLKRVGPWMASLQNRAADGTMIFSAENEGENSESLFDVTDPASVVEIQRMVPDLATINGPVAASTIGTAGLAGQFTAGQVIAVGVDFATTGGARQSVNYIYRQVAGMGDDGSGRPAFGPAPANPPKTSAYLEKQTASDPGPSFIVNGLAGRGGTTEGNFATTIGTGTDTVVFSDRIWILTFVASALGNYDIFQIVDLSTAPPWRITENVEFNSSFGGMIGPDNKLIQVRNGKLEIIDISENPKTMKTVQLFHPTAGVLMNARTLSLRYLP